MYSSSDSGYGCYLPSEVWYGQDGRVCPIVSAADWTRRWRGRSVGALPHEGAGVSGWVIWLVVFSEDSLASERCCVPNIQICHEFERFTTYLPEIKVSVFYGGVAIKTHKDLLKNECPHIVVGTPGRILDLARQKDLNLKHVRHFILDECDKMLESLGKLIFFSSCF